MRFQDIKRNVIIMFYIEGIENLNDFIIENTNKTIVLYFGADWCQPCSKLKTKFMNNETKIEMPNLVVGYINIDNELNTDIVENYNIKMLPTSIFIELIDDIEINIIDRIDGHDWTKMVMIYNKINIEN